MTHERDPGEDDDEPLPWPVTAIDEARERRLLDEAEAKPVPSET